MQILMKINIQFYFKKTLDITYQEHYYHIKYVLIKHK